MKSVLFHGVEELQLEEMQEPPAGTVNTLKIVTEIAPMTSDLDTYDAFDTRSPGWLKAELKPAVA